ncbi:MAG: hypothetical protein JWO03_1277 [Bacteroidetes bacterium]|nr:hypothetical protein [Bacteroidota bacterium]
MRFLCSLSIIVLCLLCSSCRQRAHGRRVMTTEDSLRRAAAIIEATHLSDMEKVREDFEGPVAATGTGEVSRGDAFKTDALDDFTKAIIRSFEKYNGKLTQAMKDSTTAFGVLMSRFSVQDSLHKYMAATYSRDGHLLTFHSEITQDDRHKLAWDLYFDKGKLIYFHERHSYTIEDDEQDALTDDSYFISAGRVLYSYRDDGHAQHQRDHMDLIHVTRYSLRGDVAGHAAKAFEIFQIDYAGLLMQPLESMVYTPAVRIPMPEIPVDKKVPTRGVGF